MLTEIITETQPVNSPAPIPLDVFSGPTIRARTDESEGIFRMPSDLPSTTNEIYRYNSNNDEYDFPVLSREDSAFLDDGDYI